MPALTPKQAEIRSRESKILALVRPMVAKEGLSGLSMDLIAKKMKYTKGTIYNHFACKEEILLALAIQASETRIASFDVAQLSQSASRDRMAAIGVACEDFRVRFSDLFQIESMVRHGAVWDKASDERRELLINCEARTMQIVASIARDAVDAGDLQLERQQSAQDVVFGLWSVSYGGMLIDTSSPGLSKIGIKDTFAAIRRNGNALMDGFNWQPLYRAETYQKLVTKVRRILSQNVPKAISPNQQGGGAK